GLRTRRAADGCARVPLSDDGQERVTRRRECQNMTPAAFLRKRSPVWEELEGLVSRMNERQDRATSVDDMLRFARLYRAVCTDLSLAGALRLPVAVQTHLEDLVARSHNHLYSGRKRRTI